MSIVDKIIGIFEKHGHQEYLGEAVTMAEHMLQSAFFANQAGEPKRVIVAALLHDIGHFTSELGSFSMEDTKDRYHEDSGAVFLEKYFPSTVVDCVKHHVAAKRYLCATDQDYFSALSEASVHSLNLQGGPMSSDEVMAFEREPNLAAIVRVRKYDDRGKDPGIKVPDIYSYRKIIEEVSYEQQAL